MNILEDIKDIIKDEYEHHVKVVVEWDGITVYLDYDPDAEFTEQIVLPIRYETYESFAYIPHDEYMKLYKPNDYGIDLHEISLVKKIMEYLESHSEEINKLCYYYCCDNREKEKKKEPENNNKE